MEQYRRTRCFIHKHGGMDIVFVDFNITQIDTIKLIEDIENFIIESIYGMPEANIVRLIDYLPTGINIMLFSSCLICIKDNRRLELRYHKY